MHGRFPVYSRRRRGGPGSDPAACHEPDLNAPVLLTPFPRRVIGHRLRNTGAVRSHDPADREIVLLGKISGNDFGPLPAETPVECVPSEEARSATSMAKPAGRPCGSGLRPALYATMYGGED